MRAPGPPPSEVAYPYQPSINESFAPPGLGRRLGRWIGPFRAELGRLLGTARVHGRGSRGREDYPMHISPTVLCAAQYPYNTGASLIA